MKSGGRRPVEIGKGAVPTNASKSPAEPVEQEVGGLDAEHVGICGRQAQSSICGSKSRSTCWKSHRSPAVVGKDHHGPGPGAAPPTGTPLALDERGQRHRPLVLEDGAHVGIVEADLKGARGHGQVHVRVSAGVLRQHRPIRSGRVQVVALGAAASSQICPGASICLQLRARQEDWRD